MSHKRYVVGLGEVLWDVFEDGKKLGGAPANFAYHAGQVLGMDSSIVISALGNDDLAEETIADLKGHGLNHLLPRVPFPTGTVQVSGDKKKAPTYVIKENVAWDNIPFTEDIADIARNCRAVCFGSLAQRCEVSQATIGKFLDATPSDCLKVFDINLRQQFYNKELLRDSIKRCNILKINDEELELVTHMFDYPRLDFWNKCRIIIKKYNLKMLILTCGIKGSYVFTSNNMFFLDSPKVEVADTVGAGDSFTGSFIGSILRGETIANAHHTAVQVSAFVCTQAGAMPIVPPELVKK